MLIVICGTGPDQYLPERLRCHTGWDETVLQIASGEWTDISEVQDTSTNSDVLPQMAKQVMTIWAGREEPLTDWQRDFIEQNVSVQAANKFAMENA